MNQGARGADPGYAGRMLAIPDMLWSTAALQVRRVPHPSNVCVVTFGNYADDPAEDRPGFAEAFLNGRVIDAVHVISRRNDWYHTADMPGAIAAIRAALGGKRVFTYGSSMGGYAALRFAGALGAVGVIAISPQFSLDHRVVPWERRWRPEAARIRFLAWPDDPAPPATVFFDPRGSDARHVALWAAGRVVVAMPLPYSGHPSGAFLAELGLLRPAVLDILAGRFDAAALVRAARARRRWAGRTFAALADAQPAYRRRWALRLMRRAVAAAPGSTQYASELAIRLHRAGAVAEAEAFHRRALRLSGDDPLFLFRLSRFLEREGRFHEARVAADAAAVARPADTALLRHATRLARLAGPPGLVRFMLRTSNVATARVTTMAWRRGWPAWGRLGQP